MMGYRVRYCAGSSASGRVHAFSLIGSRACVGPGIGPAVWTRYAPAVLDPGLNRVR